jgi:hypothetical protein
MTPKKIDNPAEKSKGEETVAEAKETHIWTTAQDLLLLRQAVTEDPWCAPHGKTSERQENIAKALRGVGGLPPDLKITAVVRRLALLEKAFDGEKIASLRSTGTDEEFAEREQLLEEMDEKRDMARKIKENKLEAKNAKEDLEKRAASDVRNMAMGMMDEGRKMELAAKRAKKIAGETFDNMDTCWNANNK